MASTKDETKYLIDLHIYFTGLMVFVEEAQSPSPATLAASKITRLGEAPLPRVHALVVDVRNPETYPAGRQDTDKRRSVIPHIPVVQFLWCQEQERTLSDKKRLYRALPPLPRYKPGCMQPSCNPPDHDPCDGEAPLRELATDSLSGSAGGRSALIARSASYQLDRLAVGVPKEKPRKVPRRRGLWILEKEILQLDPNLLTVEQDLVIDRRALPTDSSVPGKKDMGSINWVAPIKGRYGEPARLKKGITDPLNSAEARERLAATFLLDRGRLAPAAFASELGHFVSFTTGGTTQAMVSVLELNLHVRGKKVPILSTKFDGSPGVPLVLSPQEYEWKPENDVQKARMEVWVLNREWIAIRDQTPARPVGYREINPEYLFLYDLIDDATRPGEEEFPVAVDKRRARDDDDSTFPGCQPCDDEAMKRIYFVTGTSGEAALSAPCSPIYTREGQG